MAIQKVLICDDAAVDRTNLEKILSKAGCSVISTTNGKEAYDKAKAEKPDIIFLDIIMPEMDGYETCRLLTNDPETSQIPVVFVTSKNQKADRVWAQMQGGADLVPKPYSDEQIVEKLKKA